MRAPCPFVCVIHLILCQLHRQFYHGFTEVWRTIVCTEKSHLFREVGDSLWCYLIILFIKVLCIISVFKFLGFTTPKRSSRDAKTFLLAKTKGCFFVADHAIKIWRLFPFAEEALAPLMTLYCHETPRRLTVAHHKLCAAFHEPATASYNIVVFKTTQKSKCFIQIHVIIFLGTSIAVKRLRHFSIYSAAI